MKFGIFWRNKPWLQDWAILIGLWEVHAGIQTLWLKLDQSVPSWDPAKHLIGSLNYWWVLQDPSRFSSVWWERLWMLSSSYTPLLYVLTTPVQNWLGPSADHAIAVNLGFTALLLGSVYGLGRYLFNPQVGLWAAAICLLFPRLYTASLDYLLDYPATAFAIFNFYSLTVWRGAKERSRLWIWSVILGLGLGLMLLIKQTVLLFFLFPLGWLTVSVVWQRQWERSLQLLLIGWISWQVIHPWVSTNWIFMIGAGGNSLGSAASHEGDPAFNTLAAWTYYLKDLPSAVSWPLLLGAIGGMVVGLKFGVRGSGFGVSPAETLCERGSGFGVSPVETLRERGSEFGDATRTELEVSPAETLRVGVGEASPQEMACSSDKRGFSWGKAGGRWSLCCGQMGFGGSGAKRLRAGGVGLNAELVWLLVYILGGYVCWSLVSNKDNRYIMPYLPAIAVVLAYGLSGWRVWRFRVEAGGIKGLWIQWGVVGLATGVMVANLFSVGSWGNGLAEMLAPNNLHFPYQGAPWPHARVMERVIETSPYQLSNLGLLTSSIQVNAETLNYSGSLQNFQVYTRGVGNRQSFKDKDLRSLSWFIAQTDPGATVLQETHPSNRVQMLQAIDRSPNFQRDRQWLLPDGTRLLLYRRKTLPVQVKPLQEVPPLVKKYAQPQPVYLSAIRLPNQAFPNQSVAVTYEWTGTWDALHQGLVLLTWQQQLPPKPLSDRAASGTTLQDFWIHDHGIGLGTLRPGPFQANQFTFTASTVDPDQWFQVQEQTAMLPPPNATPGVYGLEAVYLDPRSGQTTPLVLPPVTLVVNPPKSVKDQKAQVNKPQTAKTKPSPPVPELDWVTQLRELAKLLPQGPAGLTTVFDQLGVINLYDPIQNYLVQAEKTLEVRLQQDPQNLDYAYGLVLARVMQRKVEGTIEALQQTIENDPKNPYGYAYLGFVNLYRFHPHAAQEALRSALALKPDSAEIQGLSTVAALLQGDLWTAWFRGHQALDLVK